MPTLHGKLMEKKGCFIEGKWWPTSQSLPVHSPWSGEVVGEFSLAGPKEWEAAMVAAQEAAEVLKKWSSQQRRQLLEAMAAGVKARRNEFVQTIVAEGGKPLVYARAEMARGVTTFTLAAEEAGRIGGEVLPLDLTQAATGRWGITRRFPVGPVLGIAPFNFPFNLVAHKVGPTLAAGNPIIVKPASATPLTALKLAEVYEEAGGPPGAVPSVDRQVGCLELIGLLTGPFHHLGRGRLEVAAQIPEDLFDARQCRRSRVPVTVPQGGGVVRRHRLEVGPCRLHGCPVRCHQGVVGALGQGGIQPAQPFRCRRRRLRRFHGSCRDGQFGGQEGLEDEGPIGIEGCHPIVQLGGESAGLRRLDPRAPVLRCVERPCRLDDLTG